MSEAITPQQRDGDDTKDMLPTQGSVIDESSKSDPIAETEAPGGKPITDLKFDQWVAQSYVVNEYRATYLRKHGNNENRAMLGAVIGSIDADMPQRELLKEAKIRYFQGILGSPRDATLSLAVWDDLNPVQQLEAQLHFFDLDGRLTRRTQENATVRVKAENAAKRPYEEALADVHAEIVRLDAIAGPETQKVKTLRARKERLINCIYDIGQGKLPDGRLLKKDSQPGQLDPIDATKHTDPASQVPKDVNPVESAVLADISAQQGDFILRIGEESGHGVSDREYATLEAALQGFIEASDAQVMLGGTTLAARGPGAGTAPVFADPSVEVLYWRLHAAQRQAVVPEQGPPVAKAAVASAPVRRSRDNTPTP